MSTVRRRATPLLLPSMVPTHRPASACGPPHLGLPAPGIRTADEALSPRRLPLLPLDRPLPAARLHSDRGTRVRTATTRWARHVGHVGGPDRRPTPRPSGPMRSCRQATEMAATHPQYPPYAPLLYRVPCCP